MLNSKLFLVLVVIVILVTACGDQEKVELKANNTASIEEAVSQSQNDSQSSQGGISTSQPLEQLETNEETIEGNKLTTSNFEAKLLIDLKSYEDQLSEEKKPILTALENNLIALVEHDSRYFVQDL